MTDKDVTNFVNGLVDFFATIFSALQSAVNVIPPTVLGFIVFILIILYAFRRAHRG